MRRWGFSLVLVASVSVLGLPVPAGASSTPPPESFSYYMNTVSQSTLYNLGYLYGEGVDSGAFPQNSIVMLEWGRPYCTSSTACGTYIYSSPTVYETTASERAATEQFALGVWNGLYTDYTAVVGVAMGTSNYGSFISNSTNAYNDGLAWSNMVTSGNNWFNSEGISSQLHMYGAIDAELNWDSPSATLSWGSGYDSVGTSNYYDIGDAAGCTGACNNGWTHANVNTIAWGDSEALAFPEIYANGDASDWAAINSTNPMLFVGALSQNQACIDEGLSCTGTDNTPNQAWTDLYNAVGSS